mgnify:CR=1 FL=1
MCAWITMPQLERAFAKARNELAQVGLLEDGRYLDNIDCVRSLLPTVTSGVCAWVYDGDSAGLGALVGFRTGVIYVSPNPPLTKRAPGTLSDVIRHEFAHAWYWLDPEHVDARWFRKAFGARYDDPAPRGDGAFDAAKFVTPYAMTNAKEDFAETFMTYLRCHASLGSWARRPGVYAKLLAVEDAVGRVTLAVGRP